MNDGQTNLEHRDAFAVRVRAHRTAVHLDEMLDERHAGRESALRLAVGDLAVPSSVRKDAVQALARDGPAARADENGHRAVPPLGRNHDAAAAIHAARCGVDEVREHTRQPFRIGIERNGVTR